MIFHFATFHHLKRKKKKKQLNFGNVGVGPLFIQFILYLYIVYVSLLSDGNITPYASLMKLDNREKNNKIW